MEPKFIVIVCMRTTRKIEVARYEYDTIHAARFGRLDIMQLWVKTRGQKVLVSAVKRV